MDDGLLTRVGSLETLAETTNMPSATNGCPETIEQYNETETTNMSSATNGCQDMTEEHNETATATINAHLITSSPTDELKCCPCCTLKVTVTNIDDIKKGDHICYRPSWYSPYRHHAIVKNVNVDEKKLDLIHFTQSNDSVGRSFFRKKFSIKKTLNNSAEEMNSLEVVKYLVRPFNQQEIITNAEKIMEDGKHVNYNICTYNCEHLCYQSTIGYKSSKQVKSCLNICGLFSLSCLVFFTCKFIIIPIIYIAPVIAESIAIALFTFVSILLLLHCILNCSSCCKNYKSCKSCFPGRCDRCIIRHNYIRWIRFSFFVVLQLPSLFFEIHFIRQENRHEAIFLTELAFAFVTLFTISKVPNVVRYYFTKGNYLSVINV